MTVVWRPLGKEMVADRSNMVKIFRFLFVCAVMLAIAGCGFVGITLWYFGRDLPDYQQLAHYQPPIMTRVHAGDGRLLAEYATERRIFVPIQAIPKPVINAFLSAEDKNFYNHHGVDPVSILRAAITDVSRFRANRRPVGASTITQQVAKNMLLSNEVSIERKIKEILLATRIEAALPKERILELYLNEIYLGSGAYGVAAAALTYFDKSLDELTLGEAAFLAGLPKAPNRYSPARFPQTAKARRDWVVDRMVEDGVATQAEAAQAEAQPLEIRHRQEAEEVRAPYFAEEVRRDLLARYGEKVLYGAGLSVRTSLDERLQAASDKALRTGLIAYEHSHGGWRGAIARIDPKGDWAAHLAAVPVPGVATRCRMAPRDGGPQRAGRRGYRLCQRRQWAHSVLRNALGAAALRQWQLRSLSARRGRCRQAGRCRDGRPDQRRESRAERRQGCRPLYPRPLHVVPGAGSLGRPCCPWTRTPGASSRSAAGSASRRASSTGPPRQNGKPGQRSNRSSF